ncbi:MAG: helix-turn-helix transcriptional regulator [Candidatus Omnitrophica bacterium]|nr:helix-turn-helix transcriptional regulator [Candidatus Omnitrophota bacterium]
MKQIRAKTHQEVLRSLLRDARFRKGYEEELEKLRIVDTLIRLREQQGLTQAGLAHRIGVSQPFIAKLESGETHNFSLETLVKLAVALDSELEVRFHPHRAKAA